MSKSVSVIIVSWNSEEPMRLCLKSLDALGLDSLETIIVDSNSQDNTVAFLKELEASELGKRIGLTVHYCSENVGWAKGNELGLRTAAGKWLLLCNPDIVFTEDFKQMIRYAEQNNYSVLAAQLVKPNGTPQRCLRRITFTRLFFAFTTLGEFLDAAASRRFIWKDFHYGSFKFDRPVMVDHPSASFLMINRELPQRLGHLISEDFPLYFGDSDLFSRLQGENIPVVFLPFVRIGHEMGYSGKKVAKDVHAFRWTKGMVRYAKKWRLHAGILVLLLLQDAVISPFLSYNRILKLPRQIDFRVSALKLKGALDA